MDDLLKLIAFCAVLLTVYGVIAQFAPAAPVEQGLLEGLRALISK